MPKRIYPLTVTVPAGTQQSNPVSQSFTTEDNQLDAIELIIPPGHNGLTGVRVMKGDTQLIPWGSNSWIIGNDYSREFPVDDYLPTRDVTVQAYNMGNFAHSFYLRAIIEDYVPQTGQSLSGENQTLNLGASVVSPDPLSSDAILGVGTADAINNGSVSADDLIPIDTSDIISDATPPPLG